jgi:uncharacterized protein YndB with AHSA1/START domain
VTASEPPAVVVRRILPAAATVVYDEWLDSDALSEWMCPRPARATKIQIDPRVGGGISIDIEEGGIAFTVTGTYVELDRPRRLAFTWTCSHWDPALDSLVVVTLEPHGDGATHMTIRHDLPSQLRADHEHGWTVVAQQLDERLRGLT